VESLSKDSQKTYFLQPPQGPRGYDWARVRVNSHEGTQARWFLFRRSVSEESFYLVHAPATTSLAATVEAAGKRWPVEECFESAKGEVGLDDYEVRSNQSQNAWARRIEEVAWERFDGGEACPHPLQCSGCETSDVETRSLGSAARAGLHPAVEPLAAPPSGRRQTLPLPPQSAQYSRPTVVQRRALLSPSVVSREECFCLQC